MSAPERTSPAGRISPDGDGKSAGQLAGLISEDLSRLFHQFHEEVEQAKTEVPADGAKRRPGKAAAMLAAAAVGAVVTFVLLSFALVFGLGAVMPLGWAALIVAVIIGVVTAGLYDNGRKALRPTDARFGQPVGTIKDDR
jgi:Putative Actinobacterial Holin-X, holin superfamily III